MAYEFPQVMAPEKFKGFMEKIKDIGVPNTFNVKSLDALGYKTSHDQKFLNVLKFIGLIENKRGGSPTDRWKLMRGEPRKAIAEGVREGYGGLFALYPDAHLRDSEALASYFAANSTASKESVQRIVATFQTLCGMSDFRITESSAEAQASGQAEPTADKGAKVAYVTGPKFEPVVHINIQMQLPADATGEIYEKFFEAMKAKLFDAR